MNKDEISLDGEIGPSHDAAIELQSITDFGVGRIEGKPIVFLRLDYRSTPDSELSTRAQYQLNREQALWLSQRLQYWSDMCGT